MIYEFRLPDLGEGITEGEIVKWRVAKGDPIEEHQVVLEIETDKAIVEVPSPKKGRVSEIKMAEGSLVAVGAVLFTVEVADEPGQASEAQKPKEEYASVVGTMPDRVDVLASPKARALAKKLGIDLSSVKGTGHAGIVTESDVTAAAGGAKAGLPLSAPKEAASGSDKFGLIERVPIKGVRKAIAKNLIASMRAAAFVTGMDDADVTELWDLRARERKAAREKGIHLTFMPFIMKAVQHALGLYPSLNGSVDEKGEEIIIKKYYNIGVAVETPDGLMVSVVKNVEKKTILEIASELQEMSRKARERKITLEELKGSSFTITNYGSFGGVYATPIINYPDIAILGTGRIKERPWVKDGAVVARKTLPLSLTFDHRVLDGADASQFLNKVIGYIEDPASIFIESA